MPETTLTKTAFIGVGAMGGAIATGYAKNAATQPGDNQPSNGEPGNDHPSGATLNQLYLFDTKPELAERVAQIIAPTPAVSATATSSLEEALTGAQTVVLAVKPQVQAEVIAQVTEYLNSDALVISIAAGRTLEQLAANFAATGHPRVPLVRVMPNVNAQVGAAMSALAPNSQATAAHRQVAEEIFGAVGTTIWLPESQFSIFTALAGSSPAWFFQVVDALARAGVNHGLTKADATKIATQAMLGSAKMLQTEVAQGTHPGALIDRVCSPAGTTIAGLLAAEAAGLSLSLTDAVDATVQRDRELGQLSSPK